MLNTISLLLNDVYLLFFLAAELTKSLPTSFFVLFKRS